MLYRIRCALARFMYGRNGVDQLCLATLALSIVLKTITSFLRVPALYAGFRLLAALLLALSVWRALSRNVAKRRAENAKFLYWFSSRSNPLWGWLERRRDTAHKYVRCACGTWRRVPRGVGKVELMCPRCGAKKIVKT